MNKDLQKNIVLVLITLVIIIVAGISLVSTGIITKNPPKFNSKLINTSLIIDYGNNQIDSYTIKIGNATVYSVLIQASKEYNFKVEAKYFEQFQCHYIYSINSTTEGQDNKFWQYYINGNYGIIGSDLQPVKEGDIIEWKYQEPKI